MDKFRVDSHKLIFHIDRLNDWLKGENIYPIYIEVSPSNACNQRCSFCALDYMGYKPIFLDTKVLKDRIFQMAALGIKSIMYAGEGEPLIHKDIADLVNFTKDSGVDVAVTSNGVFLNKDFLDQALEKISWIKISINAGTKETYAKIHGTNSENFDKVLKNLAYAVNLRQRKGYLCALGMQIILLPENYHELSKLAKIAKDIGLDYLVVKPYSQHPFSKTKKYKNIKYSKYLKMADELNKFSDNNFSAIFRINTMKKWDEGRRNYRHCLALPFWAYIDSGGNVWGCGVYLGDKRFFYGNIYRNTFQEIWKSKKCLTQIRWAANKFDVLGCRINCRMDEANRYLWELRHPPEHVNFI